MYKIFVSSSDLCQYGIDTVNREFLLNSAEDVCNVIKSLSALKLVYTLSEVEVSSVDDVLENFLSKKV